MRNLWVFEFIMMTLGYLTILMGTSDHYYGWIVMSDQLVCLYFFYFLFFIIFFFFALFPVQHRIGQILVDIHCQMLQF